MADPQPRRLSDDPQMKTRVNAALDIQYLLESGSTNKRLYHISNPFNIIHSHRLKGILIYIYYFGILIFHGMDDLDHRNPGIAPPPAAGTSLGLAWDLESWGNSIVMVLPQASIGW